jgi:adenylate cyclase
MHRALKKSLVVPTIIFLLFNIALFAIVKKADRIITNNTKLLVGITHNMEKYLSSSAINAIYEAVTLKQELFQGTKETIVVFFSDVRGFTTYSEHNEPEVVVKQLNRIFELQADIIHDRGGVIDKFVGDEIMATFAWNHAEAATMAALEIANIINNNQEIDFEVGVSVHLGDAVVGSIGTNDRRDYTAIGNTVNTGARLCSVADAGEVIISEDVYNVITNSMQQQFQPIAPLHLKGKQEAITAYSQKKSWDEKNRNNQIIPG